YASQKTIPKRQYERDSWHCDYCPYSEKCWENYQQEFEELATEVDLTEELETICAYYLETNMHRKEMEKEEEKLKENIKNVLKEKGVREGIAGKYIIIITGKLIESYETVRKSYFQERLKIFLKKEVKENGKSN
ncbi:MAG: hypothetical protein AB1297_03115, partial [bacterium]